MRKLVLLLLITAFILTASPARAGSPPATNPLTGLPADDPASLNLPPALISIANFPVSARPQAGLSYAPIVYELYIGEGMTRFLALFYGDLPAQATAGGMPASQMANEVAIGPVRSGRVAYEKIRQFYQGFLVIASGYQGVLRNLSQYTNFYGQNKDDVNGALIPVTKLAQIAQATGKTLDPAELTGMHFAAQAPAGQPGQVVWLPYSFYNQVFWRYDPASGAYHRYQDNADAQNFVQVTDRLNGEPLAFENVVVLFARHEKITDTIFDLDLAYKSLQPAMLFRDGQVYDIFWTTANGDYEKETGKLRPIRFVDAQGNPFPLKPGQTWIEAVTQDTYAFETIDSQSWYDMKTNQQPGSGIWAVRFVAP